MIMLTFRYVGLIFIGLLYNKSLIQCNFDINNNNNHNNHSINSNKKIAFLFMTRGPMPLEDVWRAFFNLHDEIHSNSYSIYIHPHSGYHYPPTSIFYQKVVDDHIEHVDWGGISQVRSIKHLVIEALKDPMNDRFCLMSESCIPLHSFTTFRNTLLSSNKSIVNACPWGGMEGDTRWRESLTKAGWQRKHWRKSATWFSLTRPHAMVFVNATDNGWTGVPCCDEHYLPTVLASHGLDDETTCSDGFAYAYWPNDYVAHPTTFGATAITSKFIKTLQTFHSKSQSNMNMKCSGVGHICHFTARKFSHGANFPLLERIDQLLNATTTNNINNNLSSIINNQNYNPWHHYVSMLRQTKGKKMFLIHNSQLKRIPDEATKISLLHELHLPIDIFVTTSLSLLSSRYNNNSTISDITEEDHEYYSFGKVMLSRMDGHLYKSHLYTNPQLWYIQDGKRHAIANKSILDMYNLTYSKHIYIADEYDLELIPVGSPIK